MINYNIVETEIAKSDFDSLVEVQDLKSYSEEHVNGFMQAQKDLMYKAEVEMLSSEEEDQLSLFKAELSTLKSVKVLNDDLTRETIYYRSKQDSDKANEITKSFEEKQSIKEQELFDTILKGFEAGFIDEDTFEKAVGHKYFKREAKAGGGYKYYYTEAQYKKEKGGEKTATREDLKKLSNQVDEASEKLTQARSEENVEKINAAKKEWSNLAIKYDKMRQEVSANRKPRVKQSESKQEGKSKNKPLIASSPKDLTWEKSPYGGEVAKYKMGNIMKYTEDGKTNWSVSTGTGQKSGDNQNASSLEDAIKKIDAKSSK